MEFNVDIQVRLNNGQATFNINDQRIIDRYAELGALYQEYVRESVGKQLRQRLVPYVRANVKRRTGRLSRSVRLINIRNGYALIDQFYGAYQNPNTREIVSKWVRSNYRGILQKAAAEARGKLRNR